MHFLVNAMAETSSSSFGSLKGEELFAGERPTLLWEKKRGEQG